MKSTYALAALLGFALINTAFLGAYVLSSTSLSGATTYGISGLTSATTTIQYASSTATTAFTTTATLTVTSASTTTAAVPAGTNTSTTTAISVPSAYGISGSFSSYPSAATSLTLTSVARFFELHSLALAPSSWLAVAGMWIWRGRMKSRWLGLGFDSDVFSLFVKMKGGKTRLRLLDALSLPKDRLQLAQELGLDWKGVDRHLVLMKKYGFVEDRVAYGKVRMYELTPVGLSLLKLLQELSREESREATVDQSPRPIPTVGP